MRMAKGLESRVEDQNPGVAVRQCAGPRLSSLVPRPPRGVTLIELLVVIMIIALLAALVLGVASVAGETAREQHSRHMVQRLHTLLTEYCDTFKTRRVRLRESDSNTNNGIETQVMNGFPNDARRQGQALAEARLYAMREMLITEIPDHWSDVLLNDVGVDSGPPSTAAMAPLYLQGRTGVSTAFLRRYLSLVGRINALTGVANTAEEIRRNQGAECLYMIITIAAADGEARTVFGESSIGDSDGDGAPEFLDGWGHPINFLRWAPGFESQIELDANQLEAAGQSQWLAAAAGDHDPYDLFRVDPIAFRLVPLIYSPGRDEDSQLHVATRYMPNLWRVSNNQTLTFQNGPPFITSPILSPYQKYNGSYLGTPIDEKATDNVHNHMLGKR